MRPARLNAIIGWVIVIAVLAGLGFAWWIVHVEGKRTREKARLFDEYCGSVRAIVGTLRMDLSNDRWRDGALERFSTRLDDISRCTQPHFVDADWERFSDCRMRGDRACVDAFVLRARDAIPLAGD